MSARGCPIRLSGVLCTLILGCVRPASDSGKPFPNNHCNAHINTSLQNDCTERVKLLFCLLLIRVQMTPLKLNRRVVPWTSETLRKLPPASRVKPPSCPFPVSGHLGGLSSYVVTSGINCIWYTEVGRCYRDKETISTLRVRGP